MKCPKCNKEFSEPVIEFHIARCGKKENSKEDKKSKVLEKMNKEELLAKAESLEIVIEDKEATTKAQIIEMIKAKETPQE